MNSLSAPWCKICGITTVQDYLATCEAGVAAWGSHRSGQRETQRLQLQRGALAIGEGLLGHVAQYKFQGHIHGNSLRPGLFRSISGGSVFVGIEKDDLAVSHDAAKKGRRAALASAEIQEPLRGTVVLLVGAA